MVLVACFLTVFYLVALVATFVDVLFGGWEVEADFALLFDAEVLESAFPFTFYATFLFAIY